MVWLANAGLVHNYIILLCAPPLWHLGVTVVGEGIGKSDLPKLISIHVVSQHTEAARNHRDRRRGQNHRHPHHQKKR